MSNKDRQPTSAKPSNTTEHITLELKQEHEDGSATYVFQMTKDLSELCGEYGLKLLLFCGVLGKTPGSVLRELEREIDMMLELQDG